MLENAREMLENAREEYNKKVAIELNFNGDNC